MKLKTILSAHTAIADLVALDRQGKLVLHSLVRLRLAGLLRKTRPLAEDFAEQNNALVMRYGVPVLDKTQQPIPGQYAVPPGAPTYEKFRKEKQELLDADFEMTFTAFSNAEIFGKAEEETEQNQVPVDTVETLMEVGLLPST